MIDKPTSDDGSSAEQARAQFESLAFGASGLPTYIFRLYISGSTQRSVLAISGVRRICEQYLADRYQLEVIDVYQQPDIAKSAQVIAIPTLIREFPLPARRFVGDMSHTAELVALIKLGG